ncbi:MAG TPA: hypothetical protein VF635_02595 [Propionibacteriaceae bacterium]
MTAMHAGGGEPDLLSDRAARMALSCVVDCGEPAVCDLVVDAGSEVAWAQVRGAAPQAWSDAANAAQIIDTVRGAWTALAAVVRMSVEQHYFILQIADEAPRV